MLQVLGVIAALAIIAVTLVLIIAHQLRQIFHLLTGRVRLDRIVRALLAAIVGLAIFYPILIHFERKSPLHLVVKPAVEVRVSADDGVSELLGRPLTFGSEWSFSYEGSGGTASGGVTFAVHGSRAKGDVEAAANEVAGVWHLTSVVVVVKGQRVSVPTE